MKIIGIFGSPRPSGNCPTMAEKVLTTPRAFGAQTEVYLRAAAVFEPGRGKDQVEVMRQADKIGWSLMA